MEKDIIKYINQPDKTVGELQKELNISSEVLENAIRKIPNYYHVVGEAPVKKRLIKESKSISRSYSELHPISAELYQDIVNKYNKSKDLVSLSQIQEEYRLPNSKLHDFVTKVKGDLHGYFGTNIFLNQKYYYLPSRKVKGFVDKFFKWILGEFASQSAMLLNTETNELDTFYTLEEVQAGNSKKARILGFYKSKTGKNEAICGFYNNTIKFLPTLQRSTSGLRSPGFIKYDSKVRPVCFSFDLKNVMDRNDRNYFNLLVNALSHKPVSIVFGADKFRVITENFEINMSEFQPQSSQSKTLQGLMRRNYGNLSKNDMQNFLLKNQSKDRFWRSFDAGINRSKQKALFYQAFKNEMTPEQFAEFLKENEVEEVDYVKINKNKIIVGSRYYGYRQALEIFLISLVLIVDFQCNFSWKIC